MLAEGDEALGAAAIPKPVLPPSLSRIPSAPTPDETEQDRLSREFWNARIGVINELEKKRRERKHAVEKAMQSLLPDNDKARSRIRSFISLFESTYDAQRKEGEDAAPAAEVKKQLSALERKCRGLAEDLKVMHRDVIQEWGRAAGVGGPIAVWQLSELLTESADAAEQAITGRRASKRGRHGDALATAMTEAAAIVYSQLTGKEINRSTNRSSFHAFLEETFKVYDMEPSAEHCIRELMRSEFWRKFDSRIVNFLHNKA
jgi:hypothetical protein